MGDEQHAPRDAVAVSEGGRTAVTMTLHAPQDAGCAPSGSARDDGEWRTPAVTESAGGKGRGKGRVRGRSYR
ncbi:hypothetical protein GCM10010319_09620 [Streptomyces blastmyceticus]|uniref:Uncharacterized protein n=1 Tax=Streptomyces blastmyceticus TaxID=68180 RepID=A0ABP3G4G9_9ACTN